MYDTKGRTLRSKRFTKINEEFTRMKKKPEKEEQKEMHKDILIWKNQRKILKNMKGRKKEIVK